MKPSNVDDIVASVEDAVRRAYALGRADAMKRVVEMAQSDDTGLRAMALLGPPEPARMDPAPAMPDAPQPAPVSQERHGSAAQADAAHEARQAEAAAPAPLMADALAGAGQAARPAAQATPAREEPKSVGSFPADYFYPIGSKKR